MEKKQNDNKRVLRGVDLERSGLNRKLIAWVFVGTGFLSLFMWWRGRGEMDLKLFGEQKLSFDLVEKEEEKSDDTEREKLLKKIDEKVATASGIYSVYVYKLETEKGYGIKEREIMPAASILKVPAMMAALKKIENGELKIESDLTLRDADRSPGSGPMQYMKAGTKTKLDEVLANLGKKSDNTAWLMINRELGIKKIEDEILSLGMTDTDYLTGESTAVDIAKMWTKAYKSSIWEKMDGYLTDSIYEDRIPAGISSENAEIVHKVGTLDGVWADAGVISCQMSDMRCQFEPFVLVILNKNVKRTEAEEIVPDIARLVGEFETNRSKKNI